MNRIILSILTVVALAVIADARPMKDKRDGKKYETVKIGDQVWMAENLNYATKGSYCYENDESKCRKYGRLYTWEAAQNACPDGWHLPSKEEFETLINAVGGESEAGAQLKFTYGWNEDGNGEDTFGFAALPAGSRIYDGGFDNEGNRTYFWSSTEDESYRAYNLSLYYTGENAYVSDNDKDSGFSIRCLLGKKEDSPSGDNTLRDPRDGKTYKTVEIGNQVWMAEDLAFKKIFYTWKEAQTACPANWHLPTEGEWRELIEYAGGKAVAGKNLRATRGWYYCDEENQCMHGDGRLCPCMGDLIPYNGVDLYGFAVEDAYDENPENLVIQDRDEKYFWTSTKASLDKVYVVGFSTVDEVYFGPGDRKRVFSVRCIKNK